MRLVFGAVSGGEKYRHVSEGKGDFAVNRLSLTSRQVWTIF